VLSDDEVGAALVELLKPAAIWAILVRLLDTVKERTGIPQITKKSKSADL
jgi:hypothetical protein